MQLNWYELLGTILATIISTAIIFYLKDSMQRRSDYYKLKKKLWNICGKNAPILYNGEPYILDNIDRYGVMLKSKMQQIYLPVAKVLRSEIVLPCEEYDSVKEEKEKETFNKMKRYMFEMLDEMMPKIFEKVRENIIDTIGDDESDISAVIGIKIKRQLKESGYEIKKIVDSKKKAD